MIRPRETMDVTKKMTKSVREDLANLISLRPYHDCNDTIKSVQGEFQVLIEVDEWCRQI
jgi:hypothetical protein